MAAQRVPPLTRMAIRRIETATVHRHAHPRMHMATLRIVIVMAAQRAHQRMRMAIRRTGAATERRRDRLPMRTETPLIATATAMSGAATQIHTGIRLAVNGGVA